MKTKKNFVLKLIVLTLVFFAFQNCAPVENPDSIDVASNASEADFNGSPVNPTPPTEPPSSAPPVIEPTPVEPPVSVNPPPTEPAPAPTPTPVPTPIPDPAPTPTPDPAPEEGLNGMSKNATCNIHISVNGNNSNDGSFNKPVKDITTALNKISKKGTVCFLAGNYNPIKLQNIKAPKEKPLILKAHNSAIGKVFIIGNDVGRGIGISFYSSSNIVVRDFTIRNLQKGISYYSVSGGGIYNNIIERVGLEAIHVGAHLNYSTRQFEDGPSSYIEVVDNTINGTGYKIENGQRHDYGEGIYIGTGAKPGDKTNNILVKGNSIKDTSAEAIEVKPHAQYVDVIENTIEKVNLKYSGAITIAISARYAPNSHTRVIGNTIKDVTTRRFSIAGIVVGNGTTEVIGNTVSDVQGGRSIRVVKAFHNSNARNVVIKNNTIYGGKIAINDGDSGYPGMTGIVESSGNVIKP